MIYGSFTTFNVLFKNKGYLLAGEGVSRTIRLSTIRYKRIFLYDLLLTNVKKITQDCLRNTL
jgi:hypothetical protein